MWEAGLLDIHLAQILSTASRRRPCRRLPSRLCTSPRRAVCANPRVPALGHRIIGKIQLSSVRIESPGRFVPCLFATPRWAPLDRSACRAFRWANCRGGTGSSIPNFAKRAGNRRAVVAHYRDFPIEFRASPWSACPRKPVSAPLLQVLRLFLGRLGNFLSLAAQFGCCFGIGLSCRPLLFLLLTCRLRRFAQVIAARDSAKAPWRAPFAR